MTTLLELACFNIHLRMIQSCHTANTLGLELEKKAYYAAAGIDPNEMRDQMIDQPDISVFV